jgi:DnaJ-class molecular chaperone
MKIKDIIKGDLSKKPVCGQCHGDGILWQGRHWYSMGTKKTCSYCKGTGKLYWANDITKEELIESARKKLTLQEREAVGI